MKVWKEDKVGGSVVSKLWRGDGRWLGVAVYEVMGMAAERVRDHGSTLTFSRESILMLKKVYGEDAVHGDIATSLNNVGIRYYYLGKHEEALNYCSDALSMVKRIYVGYPETLHSAAAQSVTSHLKKLERDGRVRCEETSQGQKTWEPSRS